MSIYTVCYHIVWTIYLADQWQSLRNQFETIIVFCFFCKSGHSCGTEIRWFCFNSCVIISTEF